MGLTRSEQMSRIRGRNTGPEMVVRRRLWAAGVRFRTYLKTPGGRADIVVTKSKVALFIDGCFWHGCPDHYVRPRSSNEFWDRKLAENTARDRRQTLKLEEHGWTVLRVWEHEIREAPEAVVARLLEALENPPTSRRRRLRVTRVEILDPVKDLERRTLDDLRDPRIAFVEERIRSTAKVGRVRGRRVSLPAP